MSPQSHRNPRVQWELRIGEIIVSLNPDWSQVHEALLQIDGNTVNMVSLRNLAQGAGLLVGGGNEGRYLVTYFPNSSGESSFVLTDLTLTGQDVMLTIQTPARFPARWCVNRPLALSVFEHYFSKGEIPRTVRWEVDDYSGTEAKFQ